MENKELVISQPSMEIAPSDTIKRADTIAKLLTPIIENQKLFDMISGKKHVRVEGWTTMLAMLQVFPEVEFVRKLDRVDEIAYEARVVLKTIDGRVVGSGEHFCSNRESLRRNWTEAAIKSMAQTRAVGKAARLSFSWIISLSGYNTTPAEEMDLVEAVNISSTPLPRASNSSDSALHEYAKEIREMLDFMHQGDQAKMAEELKEITAYNKDGKWQWVTPSDLDSIEQNRPKWIQTIYGKVKKEFDKTSAGQ